jgi:hypothetical protein
MQSIASLSTHIPNTHRALIQTEEERAREDLTMNSPLKFEALQLKKRNTSTKDVNTKSKKT